MPTDTTKQNTALGGVTAAFIPTNAAQSAALQQVKQAFATTPVSATGMSTPTTPTNVPPPPPAPAPLTKEDILSLINSTTPQQQEAQNQQNSLLQSLKDTYTKLGTESARTAELTAQTVNPLISQQNEINNQVRALNASAFSATQLAENRQAPTFAIYGEQANIERQRSAQTYGLTAASAALSGQIALAQQNVQLALDAEFKPLEQSINYYNTALTAAKENMSRADQKKADTLSLALSEYNTQVTQQKTDKQTVYNSVLKAIEIAQSVGKTVPNSIIQQAYNSTPEGALQVISPYLGAVNISSSTKAPEVKSINGVDMQWNPAKGWEPIPITVSSEQTQKSKDQVNLLMTSIDKADKISWASGRSGVRKLFESWTQGSSDYTDLVAQTNTIRTNVLTLATDPAIKKFFGPQMSNADVQLMTAAGTTLNPELQSPKVLKEEITRLKDFAARAKLSLDGAVHYGYTPSGIRVGLMGDGTIQDVDGNKYDKDGNKL